MHSTLSSCKLSERSSYSYPFRLSAGKSNTEQQQQQATQQQSPEFHQIISFFVNICYYTLVTPFCVKRSNDGFYRVQTNKMQKVFTVIAHGLMVLFFILSYNPFEHNILKKPQHLFALISKPAYFLIVIVAYYTFWMKRAELEAILTVTQKEKITTKNVRAYFVWFTFLWIIHNLSVYATVMTFHGFGNYVEMTYTNFYKVFVQRVGFGYLIQTPYKNLTTGEQIGTGFFTVSTMYFEFVSGSLPLMIFMGAYMVYLQSLEFYHLLLRDTENISTVVEKYRYTRNFTQLVSKFVGPLIPLHLITVMCFYLYEIFEYWDPESTYMQINELLFFKNALFLFLAAEGNRKLGYLKEWLYQCQCQELDTMDTPNRLIEQDAKSKMLLEFLQNQSTTEIGLSCLSSGPLSYSSITVLFSVYCTYIFLQLQFYGGKFGTGYTFLGFPANKTD